MIGPHQGKELELMLAGEKSLAVFHDIYTDGQDISEEIIPETAFAPHVRNGNIKRFEKIITNKTNGDLVKFVCFSALGEEWRAHFYLWLEEQFFSKELEYKPLHAEIIGKLLGYDDVDIQDFLSRQS